MKKYFALFLLMSVGAIIYLSYPFSFEVSLKKENFVYLEDNKFMLNGKNFYPVVLNYIAMPQYDGNEMWACPSRDYTTHPSSEFLSKDSCLKQLRADFFLIKNMGFNTVRIVGIGETRGSDSVPAAALSIITYLPNNQHTRISISNEDVCKKYFDALAGLFHEINNAGLKAILLLRTRPEVKTTEEHFIKLARYFKNDATIMAYDLFNEPLYFDDPQRRKIDVYKITKRWKKSLKKNAPNHLLTLGMEGIREVFEWDPNILDIDFASFHPYEYEPEQVRNEMYWYGKYIKKPWIIGETAIPADNDSVSYETQKEFAHKTIKQAYNCGASGYSWWQYKDVDWHSYHANYMGVVARKGETKTGKDNMVVEGTVKPVAEEFKKFKPDDKKDSCLCLSNYYNYSQHSDCRIKGILTDKNNVPIEGGVILAWNQWWSHSYHTVTKADGSFEVLGNFPFYHWMASATQYSMVRGDVLPDTAKKHTDNIPTMNIGTLRITKLNF